MKFIIRNKKGFTLVELMITVVIVGVLVAVAVLVLLYIDIKQKLQLLLQPQIPYGLPLEDTRQAIKIIISLLLLRSAGMTLKQCVIEMVLH